MDKYTPGPWKAYYVGCGDWDLNGPVTREDWVLAAEAPELLEVLTHFMPFIESEQDDERQGPWVVKAHAAIAKATGVV